MFGVTTQDRFGGAHPILSVSKKKGQCSPRPERPSKPTEYFASNSGPDTTRKSMELFRANQIMRQNAKLMSAHFGIDKGVAKKQQTASVNESITSSDAPHSMPLAKGELGAQVLSAETHDTARMMGSKESTAGTESVFNDWKESLRMSSSERNQRAIQLAESDACEERISALEQELQSLKAKRRSSPEAESDEAAYLHNLVCQAKLKLSEAKQNTEILTDVVSKYEERLDQIERNNNGDSKPNKVPRVLPNGVSGIRGVTLPMPCPQLRVSPLQMSPRSPRENNPRNSFGVNGVLSGAVAGAGAGVCQTTTTTIVKEDPSPLDQAPPNKRQEKLITSTTGHLSYGGRTTPLKYCAKHAAAGVPNNTDPLSSVVHIPNTTSTNNYTNNNFVPPGPHLHPTQARPLNVQVPPFGILNGYGSPPMPPPQQLQPRPQQAFGAHREQTHVHSRFPSSVRLWAALDGGLTLPRVIYTDGVIPPTSARGVSAPTKLCPPNGLHIPSSNGQIPSNQHIASKHTCTTNNSVLPEQQQQQQQLQKEWGWFKKNDASTES